jgi:hypothetical protein
VDGNFEPGYTKVALFAKKADDYLHAAILDETGTWSSKLGDGYDIHHKTAECICGPRYGTVMCYMRRKIGGTGDKAAAAEKPPQGSATKGQVSTRPT